MRSMMLLALFTTGCASCCKRVEIIEVYVPERHPHIIKQLPDPDLYDEQNKPYHFTPPIILEPFRPTIQSPEPLPFRNTTPIEPAPRSTMNTEQKDRFTVTSKKVETILKVCLTENGPNYGPPNIYCEINWKW